jgi:hypothetical protein
MIFALGGHFLFREVTRGNWVGIIAIVAVLLLIRLWAPLTARVREWWRSR